MHPSIHPAAKLLPFPPVKEGEEEEEEEKKEQKQKKQKKNIHSQKPTTITGVIECSF